MMRYISRSKLNIPTKYKNQATKFAIDIRGTLNREDIYFNYNDVELLFGISLDTSDMISTHSGTGIVGSIWMENDIDRIKYLCYSELIVQYQLYRKVITHNRVFEFISLINTILDDENCINNHNETLSFSDTESLTDSFSDRNSFNINTDMEKSEEVNKYLILAYQHKIEMLTQLLDNKNTEIQVKERDITIAKLQMQIELNKKNEIINTLTKKIELLEVKEQWI